MAIHITMAKIPNKIFMTIVNIRHISFLSPFCFFDVSIIYHIMLYCNYFYQIFSVLTYSYTIIAVATDAFRLSVFPNIGIFTFVSVISCISFDTPFASFPITITFLLYFISYMLLSVSNDVTITSNLCFFISFNVVSNYAVSIIFTLNIAPIVERTTLGL